MYKYNSNIKNASTIYLYAIHYLTISRINNRFLNWTMVLDGVCFVIVWIKYIQRCAIIFIIIPLTFIECNSGNNDSRVWDYRTYGTHVLCVPAFIQIHCTYTRIPLSWLIIREYKYREHRLSSSGICIICIEYTSRGGVLWRNTRYYHHHGPAKTLQWIKVFYCTIIL